MIFESFDIARFIAESNLIDPEFDPSHRLVPGAVPGDPMFDRQWDAWRYIHFMVQSAQARGTPHDALHRGVVRDLHRELTRGLPWYEDRGNSGCYRRSPVTIGGSADKLWSDGEQTAPPSMVPFLVEEYLLPIARFLVETTFTDASPFLAEGDDAKADACWAIHHLFQCIHPFIDGNGRTGRLLLSLVRLLCGLQPIVIHAVDKEAYFDGIRAFRAERGGAIIARAEAALDLPPYLWTGSGH